MSTFYRLSESGSFVPTESVRGPWSEEFSHGGPPSALFGRAFEHLLAPLGFQLVDVNVTAPNANTAPVFLLKNGFTTPTLANVNPALLQWRIQDPDQKTPTVYQFSAGPEYQVFSSTVLSVEYVGNLIRNGRRLRNLNQGQITGPSIGEENRARTPDPNRAA